MVNTWKNYTMSGNEVEKEFVVVNPAETEAAAENVEDKLEDILMAEPIALVTTEEQTLNVNEKAIEILKSIKKPVVVIAIAGIYRTGKSYLMNRLAGKSKGFALGASIQSETKGIWFWAVPHPLDKEKYMILIDTEGLGDAEKGDPTHDAKIFSLAVLLSSTLVYNSKDTIDQDALDKLHFVTSLSDHIAIDKNQPMNEHSLDRFLPAFIWAIRDFSLMLEINGDSVTADEYLEYCLKKKEGSSQSVNRFNDIRYKIRSYFKKRKCFVFPRPVFKARDLQRLQDLKDKALDEDFVNESLDFCKYVHENSRVKLLDNGEQINGSMLGGILDNYVNAINNGAVPCIKDAVETMAIIENQNAVSNAFDHYKDLVNVDITMPAEVEDMSKVFLAANEKAIKVFLSQSVMDKEQIFQRKLGNLILSQNEKYMNENKESSINVCKGHLKNVVTKIEDKMIKGEYSKPGGFILYMKDMDVLKQDFRKIPNKGIMASTVLMEFIEERKSERDTIMKVDEQMTDKERKFEEEKRKAEIEKLKAEEAERAKEEAKAFAEEKQAMYQEHLRQLKERQVEDHKRMEEAHGKLLEARLEEERKLLQEGQRKQAAALQAEISILQEQLNKKKNSGKSGSSCFSGTNIIKVQKGNDIITKQIKDLEIGDKVESYNFDTATIVYSPVYFISHARSTLTQDLLELSTGYNRIHIDPKHLIYRTSKNNIKEGTSPPLRPVRAEDVHVGDYLWLRQKDNIHLSSEQIIGKSMVSNKMVRHPMTMNHTIIVEGILASVHMFYENFYRSITTPLRTMYHFYPSALKSPIVEKLVESWDKVENYF